MLTVIVSDNQTAAVKLRHLLEQHGHECPLRNIVSIDAAPASIQAMSTPPDVVVFVLLAPAERCEEGLRSLRALQRSPIIVVGPKDPNSILLAVHAGADDYLDESGNLPGELIASLSRIAAAGRQTAAAGEVVTVIAASGGSGRTTVATNLAVLFARQHGSCGLLDLDLWGGGCASLLNLKPRHTIADVCRNIDKLDRNMFGQSLLRHESGVHLLPVPHSFDDIAHVTPNALGSLVRLARREYCRVVADVNQFADAIYRQLLEQSSLVVLVSRLDFAALKNARRALDFLEAIGVDRTRIRCVANRHGQPKELSISDAESALKSKISDCLPDDARTVNLSINCGNPLVVEAPKSKVSLALSGLARHIDGAASAGTPAPVGAARTGSEAISTKLLGWLAREPSGLAAAMTQ